MNLEVNTFFEKTDFDNNILKALEADIDQIGKSTIAQIAGFGLYTCWEIDSGPNCDFWLVSLLTPEGLRDLEGTEIYATGSWDQFDFAPCAASQQITRKIYETMHNDFIDVLEDREDFDLFEKFFEPIKLRCAQLLLHCEPRIKSAFSTTENLILSVASHDEGEEAYVRMQAT